MRTDFADIWLTIDHTLGHKSTKLQQSRSTDSQEKVHLTQLLKAKYGQKPKFNRPPLMKSVTHLPPLRHGETRDGVPVTGEGARARAQLDGPHLYGLVRGAREEAVTVPEEAEDAVAVAAQHLDAIIIQN